MEAWQSGNPDAKSGLVTEMSQALLKISKEDAQALPLKDIPSPSVYEKALSRIHQQKRQFKHLSSRGSSAGRTEHSQTRLGNPHAASFSSV